MKKNILPNFLVIGAQRCATSWLYFCLKQHPDVYLPYIKELSYFTDYYHNGPDWYREYFQFWKGEKAVGEVTPSYIYRPEASKRIANDLPDARLIVTFRNPTERAYSQYLKQIRTGRICVDFETALQNKQDFLERGRYYEQLMRYLEVFPRDRVLVMIYEDILSEPEMYLKKIFLFLGITDDFVPQLASEIIPSEDLDSGLYKTTSAVAYFLRNRAHLGFLVNRIKKGEGYTWLRRALQRFGPSPKTRRKDGSLRSKFEMRPETRLRLREFFREENGKLADFLGRDLSFWH